MAKPSTTHSARRPEIEDWLDSKGVKWRFEESVPVENFDMRRSLHNQARFQALDDTVVERYTTDMSRGDRFPAVVASDGKKFVIIDGNHRLQAHDRRQLAVPTYVVSGDSDVLTAMTFEANVKHGMPSNEDERIQHAVWMLDHGATIESAAQAVGLAMSKVSRGWDRTRAERRARRLDIRSWDTVPMSNRTALNTIRMDESFVIAVQYCVRYQWTSVETKDAAVRINKGSSLKAQQQELDTLKEEYRDRAQQNAGGVLRSRHSNSPLRNTRSILTRVASVTGETLIGLDLSEDERSDLQERIAVARAALQELETSLTAGK